MKLLAFSDLHRDKERAQRLVELAREADLVIGAGDFATMRMGLEGTIEALGAIEAPTVLVPPAVPLLVRPPVPPLEEAVVAPPPLLQPRATPTATRPKTKEGCFMKAPRDAKRIGPTADDTAGDRGDQRCPIPRADRPAPAPPW